MLLDWCLRSPQFVHLEDEARSRFLLSSWRTHIDIAVSLLRVARTPPFYESDVIQRLAAEPTTSTVFLSDWISDRFNWLIVASCVRAKNWKAAARLINGQVFDGDVCFGYQSISESGPAASFFADGRNGVHGNRMSSSNGYSTDALIDHRHVTYDNRTRCETKQSVHSSIRH